MIAEPVSKFRRATLWDCGIRSRSVGPSGKVVPAGRPSGLTTMATLSCAWTLMQRGVTVVGQPILAAAAFSGGFLGRSIQAPEPPQRRLQPKLAAPHA